MERWVTYREVIHDSVLARPKNEERSCGDCRVTKQDFCAFKINTPTVGTDGAYGPIVRV